MHVLGDWVSCLVSLEFSGNIILVPLLQSGLGTTWFSVHVVVPFMFLLLYSYCGLASYNYIGCIYTEESNGI